MCSASHLFEGAVRFLHRECRPLEEWLLRSHAVAVTPPYSLSMRSPCERAIMSYAGDNYSTFKARRRSVFARQFKYRSIAESDDTPPSMVVIVEPIVDARTAYFTTDVFLIMVAVTIDTYHEVGIARDELAYFGYLRGHSIDML